MKAVASQLNIELDDGERRVLYLIKQADQATTRQVRIEYWGEEGGIRLSDDQYDTIFTCIGSLLPNLQDVIVIYSHDSPPLPVAALQKLIYCHHHHHASRLADNGDYKDKANDNDTVATKKLEYLSLHRVKLKGHSADFESLSDSLRRNESLKKVHLRGCSSLTVTDADTSTCTEKTNDDNEIVMIATEESTEESRYTPSLQDEYSNAGMSVLLQALAHVKSLAALHIDNVPNLSQHAVWELCHSKYIKVLELWNMTEDLNRYGDTIADALLGGDNDSDDHNDDGDDGDDDSVATTKADNHSTAITKKIRSLEELEISSSLQPAAGNAIINMLQSNETLETLGLDLDYAEYGGPLAQVLQPGCNCNTTLKTLRLRLVGEETEKAVDDSTAPIVDGMEDAEDVVDDHPLPLDEVEEDEPSQNFNNSNDKMATANLANAHQLLMALESNATLEHLHMNFYHISPETVQTTLMPSVERLLQVNYALKDLTVRGKHNFVQLSEKSRFQLNLNRAGRYALLLGGKGNGMAPRNVWIETIASQQRQEDEDVSIVFCLLTMNPSLCCTANGIAS